MVTHLGVEGHGDEAGCKRGEGSGSTKTIEPVTLCKLQHVSITWLQFCNVLSLLFCAVWASEVDPEVQLAAVDALAKLGMSKNPGGSDATQCIQRFMQRYWVADTCRGNS